jgi:hypothetical protein
VPNLEVDFSEVVSQEPVRPGKYDVVIDQIMVKQSETSDYPTLHWSLTLVGGEFEGRRLTMYTSLSPKALWKLQQTFTSYGLEGSKVALDYDNETGVLIEPDLSGQPGIATIYNEPYQGRTTSKVSDLVGPGGVEEAPVPAAKTPSSGGAPEKVSPFAKKRNFK